MRKSWAHIPLVWNSKWLSQVAKSEISLNTEKVTYRKHSLQIY